MVEIKEIGKLKFIIQQNSITFICLSKSTWNKKIHIKSINLVQKKKLSVSPSSDFINDSGFEINKYSSWHMLA